MPAIQLPFEIINLILSYQSYPAHKTAILIKDHKYNVINDTFFDIEDTIGFKELHRLNLIMGGGGRWIVFSTSLDSLQLGYTRYNKNNARLTDWNNIVVEDYRQMLENMENDVQNRLDLYNSLTDLQRMDINLLKLRNRQKRTKN